MEHIFHKIILNIYFDHIHIMCLDRIFSVHCTGYMLVIYKTQAGMKLKDGWTKWVLCLSEELIIILEQRTSLGTRDINLKHWTIYLASKYEGEEKSFFFSRIIEDSIPLFFFLFFYFSLSQSLPLGFVPNLFYLFILFFRGNCTFPPLTIGSISIPSFIYKTKQCPPLCIKNMQITPIV